MWSLPPREVSPPQRAQDPAGMVWEKVALSRGAQGRAGRILETRARRAFLEDTCRHVEDGEKSPRQRSAHLAQGWREAGPRIDPGSGAVAYEMGVGTTRS